MAPTHAGGFQLVTGIRRVQGDRRIEAAAVRSPADPLGPVGFLIEAVAQAAGWLVAAATGFARRGLPLSIGTVRLGALPRAEVPVDLAAEVVAWRDTSAILRGEAASAGRPLGVAQGGMCGLLAAEQLDDPEVMRRGYAALLAPDGTNGARAMAEPPGAPRVEAVGPGGARATWDMVGGEGLFADHFPRMPVLPGSYQVQALVDLAEAAVRAGGGAGLALTTLRQVRFRRPVRPGERLVLEVKALARGGGRALLAGLAQVGDERTTSIGEIEFGPAP